ncbi:hypothetical protein ACX3VG_03325, partial [Escherichia coli]
MMNSSIKSFSLLAVILLAGCSSPTSRIADCQAQGVSHDTCYLAEQQRQAAILSASEAVSYTHLRAHETRRHRVCRLLLEKDHANANANTAL